MRCELLGYMGSLQTEEVSNTSLLFTASECSVLVDCSGNLAKAANGEPDDIILTHEHIDHIYGLPSLIHQMWLRGRRKPLVIHADGKLLHLVEHMLALFSLREKPGIYPLILQPLVPFTRGRIRFTPYKSNHTESSYGIVLDTGRSRIVYTSDTRPILNIPDGMMAPDLLITEASGPASEAALLHKKGHQSSLDAGRLAVALRAKKLCLIHLPCKKAIIDTIREETKQLFNPLISPEHIKDINYE